MTEPDLRALAARDAIPSAEEEAALRKWAAESVWPDMLGEWRGDVRRLLALIDAARADLAALQQVNDQLAGQRDAEREKVRVLREALGVTLPPPKIVMLKRSEMQALFGPYDGYYRQGTIYLTGGVSDQLLAHEYARYGLHYAGLGNDPVRLVELERKCK